MLLAGRDGVGTLATARALHQAGCTVHLGTDHGPYAGRSRAVTGVAPLPDAAVEPERFAADVAALAQASDADVVVPTTDVALIALARSAAPCPSGVTVARCTPDVLDRVLDKEHVATAAVAAGLTVPASATWTAADARERGGDLAYPVVVKPRRSDLPDRDGRLVHGTARLARDPAMLEAALIGLPGGQGQVQPFVDGTLEGYSGVIHDGQLLDVVAVRAERTWPAECGQFSFARTVRADPGIAAAVRRMLVALGWQGIFQVDLIIDGGRAHVLDLNPRIFTSVALPVAAGRNQPATWVASLLGHECGTTDIDGYTVGLGYRVAHLDLRSLAAGIGSSGPRSTSRALWPGRPIVAAVAARGDLGPLRGILDDADLLGRMRRLGA